LPIIHIFLAGQSTAQVKKALIERISAAVVEVGCGPVERVRVLIHELDGVNRDGHFGAVAVNGGTAENHLPRVDMFLIEGRPQQVKETLIEKVRTALVELGCGPTDKVHVSIQDIPSSAWGIGGKTAQELGR
jgi:4-oxalocrotonate tautomerase